MRPWRGWAAVLLVQTLGGASAAQESVVAPFNSIAVIYPKISAPFSDVFGQIIEGVAEVTKGQVHNYAVDINTDAGNLNAEFRRNDIKVAIALGRQGLKAASGLAPDIAVVVGAVLLPLETEQRALMGISLSPDPALLFAKLTALQPNIKRIFVIYDPRHNEWLISLAREAAKIHRLELVAQEARDLATAARLYKAAFVSADPRKDAIWLPSDPTTVDENTILPLVLKASWEYNIIIFSSSLLHVKKGVLFTLYPNNRKMGRTLAHFALAALAGESRKGIAPLRAVETAINLRTAGHLGLSIGYEHQPFDSVFP